MHHKINDILKWYEKFNNNEILIKTQNHTFDMKLDIRQIPHLLGIHYMSNPVLKGKELLRNVMRLNDEEVFEFIKRNNPQQLENVKNRVKYFKYFMEHLEEAILYHQTHENSKLHSSFLLVKQEDGTYLQLGIAHDREDTDYFETFLVESKNTYFTNSQINEKIISIEKWEQDKLVPFSFNQNRKKKEKTLNNEVTIEELQQIRIEQVGEIFYGLHVIKTGKTNSFREIDSLKIYPSNTYYRFSNHDNGNVFNFVKMMSNCNFKTAVDMLKEFYLTNQVKIDQYTSETNKTFKTIKAKTSLVLPQKNEHNKNVFAYLTKQRGIDPDIVKYHIKQKNVYQDIRKNCVFVGYVDSMPTCANIRSTYSSFKGEVENSLSDVGIYIPFTDKDNTTLVICEGMIDVMSHQSLFKKSYTNMDYLSIQGVTKGKNAFYYRSQKERRFDKYNKVIIAFDNDPINEKLGYSIGRKEAKDLKTWINSEFPNIEVKLHFPKLKDFNEDLVQRRQDLQKKETDVFLQKEEIER